MLNGARVLIVIVGFRNSEDVRQCLDALLKANANPSFEVVICENGGSEAYDLLIKTLTARGGPCASEFCTIEVESEEFLRVQVLELNCSGARVVVAEAKENLGFAGGINAWIRPLLKAPDWDGLWILNPDTMPEPDALAELVSYAEEHAKGMVGSRVMFLDRPDIVGSRGLRWRRLRASTLGVDIYAPVLPPPNPDEVDARIDAPSGASFYVTRTCLNAIGLLDERYFLYYEELDWGLRAKAFCGVGYAYRSVVPHVGGSMTGSSQNRSARSALTVYFDFRNRFIFVRKHYPAWFAWTVAMALLQAGEFLFVGATENFKVALLGTLAGLRGETGRPDRIMAKRFN
jgi:N-acetylglucosaminyl-diphospho-decaprenol L-rhamnosyltransferase